MNCLDKLFHGMLSILCCLCCFFSLSLFSHLTMLQRSLSFVIHVSMFQTREREKRIMVRFDNKNDIISKVRLNIVSYRLHHPPIPYPSESIWQQVYISAFQHCKLGKWCKQNIAVSRFYLEKYMTCLSKCYHFGERESERERRKHKFFGDFNTHLKYENCKVEMMLSIKLSVIPPHYFNWIL